jgi:uncharacterized membrane protein HdeD (DUF308 family)
MVWLNLILGLVVIVLIGVQFVKFKLMHKIIASFDNSKDGFSARKLSAFAGVSVSIIATFRFVDTATIIEALMVWLCFALLCLGIITAEQVIRLRNKSGETPVVETPKLDEQKPQETDPKI